MKYHIVLNISILMSLALCEDCIVIKMATLAPKGTEWYNLLLKMGQDWDKCTNGQVALRIYPGGIVGDERDMIRKCRIGQIHAAAVTAEGLTTLNLDFNIFFLPLFYQSYDDVDWIRSEISADLEKGVEQNGFKLLFWSDVGFAYWFTSVPITHPEDLKKMKIFSWAGDYKTDIIWQRAGFRVVPLAATDILPGLQTGMINAISMVPVFALSSQIFGIAKYMLDMKWGFLTAAVVINSKVWDKISNENQTVMLEVAKRIIDDSKQVNRQFENQAIEAMQNYGLEVQQQSQADYRIWKVFIDSLYPELRGDFIPEGIFDKVVNLNKNKEGTPNQSSF